MGIRDFERRLERTVEGAFARAFKSGLRPVELGRLSVTRVSLMRSDRWQGATRYTELAGVLLAGPPPSVE